MDDTQGDVHISKPQGGPHSFQYYNVRFPFIVDGNFDVRIAFRDAAIDRADGTPGNQIQLNIQFGGQYFAVVRSDEVMAGDNVHVYVAPPGAWKGQQSNSDNSGILRIARNGTTVTGYFNDVPIWSANYNSAPVTNMWFSLHNNGTTDATSVTFDDFSLRADNVTNFDGCDTDGDGLLDAWETDGVFVEDQWTNYLLPGADPLHKDLYLEVDALVGHGLPVQARNDLIQSFSRSPVDEGAGISLHVDIGEETGPSQPWPDPPDCAFLAYRADHFGTEQEQMSPRVLAAKSRAYRYCVIIDRFDALGSTGYYPGVLGASGADFLVSLGAITNVGTEDIAGTLMHELGHALGLQHGGGDSKIGKPNYYSVMNYLWQMRIRPDAGQCDAPSYEALLDYASSWTLDYSREELPSLVEGDLDEMSGIQGNPDIAVPVGPPIRDSLSFAQIVRMWGPVNWDRMGNPDNAHAQADINYIPDCGGARVESPGETLNGFDDWANLSYAVPPSDIPCGTSASGTSGELSADVFASLGSLELDCNDNGIPDADDIEIGASTDSNKNGIPDECEFDPTSSVVAPPVSTPTAAVPSPSSGDVDLYFLTPTPVNGTVTIFDVRGAVVYEIAVTSGASGWQSVRWDGLTRDGRRSPNGLYWYRLESRQGPTQALGKFTLIR